MAVTDTGLPVEASVPELTDALRQRGAAVLVAPPGSGKTTVAPLRLAEAGLATEGKLVVLEPRRLATRAAARRMASLLGEEVGETVGYVTRDDRRSGPRTRIEVVTEGVLTRRLQRDPSLADTALVAFDELHERNLQTDLGLALALDARRALRPDLRILVMSATLDAGRVAELVGGDAGPVPVVTSDARQHPVEMRWSPPARNQRLEDAVAQVVRTAVDTEAGDVLVFLPGMGEIRRVQERLEGILAEVHLLHGSLPAEAQDAAVTPSALRKVVLSTDIAESSLTVEGVRVVVDSGLARQPRFDARTGMTRLQTVPISKASAEQRAGRAGRVEPGVCYRLWSKLEHGTRRPHIDPEITQVDLAGLALELAAWGVDDPSELAFLDPPSGRAFDEARQLLTQLGALDEAGRLTDSGRAMADLPLHPRLARMVVDAGDDAATACVVAALVDERDPLRGHPDEVPVDLGLRVRLVADPGARHPRAVGRSLQRVRRVADDLARRARISGDVDPDRTGPVLALAFPDRLAVRRGSAGRFQLRIGTTTWMTASDPLATESFLVVAELDGKRKDARIRLAAALDPEEVATGFAHEVQTRTELAWEGDRLVERTERRLGGLALDVTERRPDPGPKTTAAILERLRSRDLADLPWGRAARELQARVAWLRERVGEPWPDLSDQALAKRAEEWLAPRLAGATGLDDVQRLDVASLLRGLLPYPEAGRLDELAPTHLELASGRRVRIDYTDDGPRVRVKVQEVFGLRRTPTIAGEPVTFELLSPADRPLQVTSDLAGFWSGSWQEVRREMAGRYPKHPWPEDPTQG